MSEVYQEQKFTNENNYYILTISEYENGDVSVASTDPNSTLALFKSENLKEDAFASLCDVASSGEWVEAEFSDCLRCEEETDHEYMREGMCDTCADDFLGDGSRGGMSYEQANDY